MLILAIAFAASCAVSEASIGSDEQKEKRSLRAKSSISTVSPADSLQMVYEAQSSKSALLQGMVIKMNGGWVLAISRDDASLLGVSDSLYSNFVEYVNRLNNNK